MALLPVINYPNTLKEDTIMALSVDSKLKDILRNEEGKAVLAKWTPNLATHPAMKLIQMMTLRKLFSYPEAAEYASHMDDIDAELRACK